MGYGLASIQYLNRNMACRRPHLSDLGPYNALEIHFNWIFSTLVTIYAATKLILNNSITY